MIFQLSGDVHVESTNLWELVNFNKLFIISLHSSADRERYPNSLKRLETIQRILFKVSVAIDYEVQKRSFNFKETPMSQPMYC